MPPKDKCEEEVLPMRHIGTIEETPAFVKLRSILIKKKAGTDRRKRHVFVMRNAKMRHELSEGNEVGGSEARGAVTQG